MAAPSHRRRLSKASVDQLAVQHRYGFILFRAIARAERSGEIQTITLPLPDGSGTPPIALDIGTLGSDNHDLMITDADSSVLRPCFAMHIIGQHLSCSIAEVQRVYPEHCRTPVTGTQLLELVDTIATTLGVAYVRLQDQSEVKMCGVPTSLSMLRMITHGETWYQSHGFLPEPNSITLGTALEEGKSITDDDTPVICAVELQHAKAEAVLLKKEQSAAIEKIWSESLLDLLPIDIDEIPINATAAQLAEWRPLVPALSAVIVQHKGDLRSLVSSMDLRSNPVDCKLYDMLLNVSGLLPRLRTLQRTYGEFVVKFY